MRPIVEAYAVHKGDKKSFCQEQGVSLYQLNYRRRKLGSAEAGVSSFIALEANGGSSGQAAELYYPNGLRVVVPLEAPAPVWDRLLNFVG